MPSKLVAVNDGLHLPPAVQAQLKADLQSDFETLVTEAETAAGSATSAAISADTSADIAVAAAATATAPTDGQVAILVGDTASSTRLAMDDVYRFGVNAKSFGLSTTGDMTAVLQTAINASVGVPLVVPAGTYNFATGVTLPSGSTLVLLPGAVMRYTGTNGYFLSTTGTEGAQTLLTASTTPGTRTIVAAGHTLSPGDWFRVGSTTVYDASSTSSTIGEIMKVSGVSGDTITTRWPMVGGPYTMAAGAIVSKIDFAENITVMGGGTIKGNRIAADNQMGLYVRLGRHIRVQDVTFQDIDQRHTFFRDCVDVSVDGCTFDWATHTSQAYGTSFADACQDCQVRDSTFINVRHSLSTNNSALGKGIPRRILFQNNVVQWTSTATGGSMGGGDAIDTHTAAEEIWIEGNTVMGSAGQGINFECTSGRIVGNTVMYTASNGISVHNESDFNGRMRVENNTVIDPGAHGISAQSGIRGTTAVYERLDIRGNTVIGLSGGTSGGSVAYQIGNISGANPDRGVTLSNNSAIRCNGTGIYVVRNVRDLVYRDNTTLLSTGTSSTSDSFGTVENITLTIASDAIPVDAGIDAVNLIPQTSTTDDLITISGGRRGQRLLLRTASGSSVITLRVTGNIRLASGTTYALTGTNFIEFWSNGTNWLELGRSA